MSSYLYCLNIVFPVAFEDAVSAALIEHDPPLPGFTLVEAEGHSNDFGTASTEEHVRGRVTRRMIHMVLPHEVVNEVIASLRARVRSERVVWWTTRVEAFGRLA